MNEARLEPGEATLRQQAKAQLRERMVALRHVLPAQAHTQRSQAACKHLIELECYCSARTVALYIAFNAELDTSPLLESISALGKQACLPRVTPHSKEMTLRGFIKENQLVRSSYGILEPEASSPEIDLGAVDLIVLPALAADESGYRIGYGKGHYDRLLARMPNTTRVCLLYDFQLIAEVPQEPHDERMHWVITDQRQVQIGPDHSAV